MRLLLTSDSQAEFSNLDLCEQSLDELLAAADKYKPDAIIHAGDLKENYNPVDVRVIKWWVKATRRIKDSGWRFIANLGNHDRISQSAESKNWLDILRVAGAETVTQPKVRSVGDGVVSFLPYSGDLNVLRQWAKDLAPREAFSKPTALIFHAEIRGATFSGDVKSEGGITTKQLWTHLYDACLGGHFHQHQQLADNVWYIGSPFCQDWGEANTFKGHLLVDVSDGGVKVKQIRTAIPHWYDAEYLVENGIKPESGAYIRSKVVVTSKKITDQVRAEEKALEKKYPGVRLFVIPKLGKSEDLEVVLKGATDKEKIEQYVAATIPDVSRWSMERGVTYLASRLQECPTEPLMSSIRVLKARGERVLSFREAEIKYTKQGIVLLKGINRDWPKRSNGAGKTNTLSLLTVPWFGQSIKGQKTDRWANERLKGTATGYLALRDDRKRLIEIERCRRPHSLALRVNGKDESSGIRGTGKQETQGMIEKLTGYDMRLLLNAVYIDQTLVNSFIFGTQKDRMDLVGRLQNLGRYEYALKLVTKDIVKNEKAQTVIALEIEQWTEEVGRLESDIDELDREVETLNKTELKVAQKEVERLVKEKASLTAVEDSYQQKQDQIDELENIKREEEKRRDNLAGESEFWQKELKLGNKLMGEGKCSRCRQPSKMAGKDLKELAEVNGPVVLKRLERVLESLKKQKSQIETLEKSISKYQREVYRVETELESAREVLRRAHAAAESESRRNSVLVEKKYSLQVLLNKAKRLLKAGRDRERQLGIEREMLEYGKKAFSRTGIPMYLSAGMCPVLNKAADEYSELFWDGKVGARFAVRDAEFVVDIVNTAGSETADGQSDGESKMAGIVGAFAMREVAPKTNLLILDDPGYGLDPDGARQFALGLLKLKDKFETIILTTHNPIIESVLSGEKVWAVEKRKGISYLQCN